ILDPLFRHAGVAFGLHPKFRTMCVIVFASEYADSAGVGAVREPPLRMLAAGPIFPFPWAKAHSSHSPFEFPPDKPDPMKE
ncbi:MAG: hypothetical protein ACM3N7_10375, partial [Planctomycetaceae bacterium]